MTLGVWRSIVAIVSRVVPVLWGIRVSTIPIPLLHIVVWWSSFSSGLGILAWIRNSLGLHRRFAAHLGFLLSVPQLHFFFVPISVICGQFGVLRKTIRLQILPTSSNEFPHFLEANLAAFLLEPLQSVGVDVLIRVGLVDCVGVVFRLCYDLEDFLSHFLEEEIVGTQRTLGLVLRFLLGWSLDRYSSLFSRLGDAGLGRRWRFRLLFHRSHDLAVSVRGG